MPLTCKLFVQVAVPADTGAPVILFKMVNVRFATIAHGSTTIMVLVVGDVLDRRNLISQSHIAILADHKVWAQHWLNFVVYLF